MDFLNHENNQRLANYLLERRMEQNLTLDDISNKIGVPIQHLKKIEEGNFEEFDAFYLKMYLKKYTSSLSLNIDELYEQFYGEIINSEGGVKVKKQAKKRQNDRKRNDNLLKILGLICAALIIVLGIILGIGMVRSNGDNRNQVNEDPEIVNPNTPDLTDDDEALEEEAPEVEVSEEEPEREPETNINRISHENGTQTFEVVTEAERAEIILSFTGDCWVGTVTGTAVNFESGTELTSAGALFSDGDTETINVTENGSLTLNVGNIQFLEMTINGEIVEVEKAGLSQQWLTFNTTIERE